MMTEKCKIILLRPSAMERIDLIRRLPAGVDAGGRRGRGYLPGRLAPYDKGRAVVDLIRSMAKREVTFFNVTAPISRL